MNILGNEIGIRCFKKEDVVPFYEAAKESLAHMKEFMPWCHSEYSMLESKEWIDSRINLTANDLEHSFIIYSIKEKTLLGGIDINQINQNHKIGNIGYWVRRSALKCGVATEAVSLISSFGFNSLDLERLEIVTLPSNIASRKVAEKVGAKYEGVLQKRLSVFEVSHDACMYSLVKSTD